MSIKPSHSPTKLHSCLVNEYIYIHIQVCIIIGLWEHFIFGSNILFYTKDTLIFNLLFNYTIRALGYMFSAGTNR